MNFGVAVKLSWFFVALAFAITVFVPPINATEPNEQFFLLFFLVLCVVIFFLIATLSIAVGWHRYVLRGEQPPAFHFINRNWPLGSYFWQSIKVGFLIAIIFVPVSFIYSSIFFPFIAGAANPAENLGRFTLLTVLFALPLNAIFIYLLLRFGLVLPAAALGTKMPLMESFSITSRLGGQLFITAILLLLLYTVPSLLLLPFQETPAAGDLQAREQFQQVNLVASLLNAVFSWISTFVGVGILTVVYGHLVENRPV